MKITIYELLGLVKDGKAPKKIKYEDEIWECSKEEYYSCKDGSILLGDLFFNYKIQTFINDEVEIIEESKKIEKITVREKTLGFPNGEWTARNMDKAFANKINELIDEINNLKEKKDE